MTNLARLRRDLGALATAIRQSLAVGDPRVVSQFEGGLGSGALCHALPTTNVSPMRPAATTTANAIAGNDAPW